MGRVCVRGEGGGGGEGNRNFTANVWISKVYYVAFYMLSSISRGVLRQALL